MSHAGEPVTAAPEGAVPVTAKDVISQAVPERYEAVEYWLLKTPAGITETLRVRPEIGDKAKLQLSPLDQSVLGIHFEFHGGEKNEVTGRRYVPMQSLFFYDQAFVNEAVYKNGESPADVELKRRAKLRESQLALKAERLNENLNDED